MRNKMKSEKERARHCFRSNFYESRRCETIGTIKIQCNGSLLREIKYLCMFALNVANERRQMSPKYA